jgi:cardiolipin synthase
LRPAWRSRPKDSPALSKPSRGATGDSNCVAVTSTKKPSVSSARGSLQPTPSPKLLPPREGGLGGLTRESLERATGSPEIAGNSICLQFDGPVTLDAWLEAISGAKRYVHFENYILRNDAVGWAFRDVLVEKARQGVEIRLLYDWVGCWATPPRYWRPFRRAGVEVRAFNRPSLRDPYGVFQRDHRKLVVVDGEVAFAGGFCIGQEWAGTVDTPPWRDTGIEFRGPAVSAASRAFGRIWDVMGEPLPRGFADEKASPAGDTSVWLIEGEPRRSRVLRTVALVAAMVQERLWITDPYFIAPGVVAEAMAEAAQSGVDVRVLVPANNNWPLVGTLSRAGYRYLLEQGVRLFEWQGGMIHAKTSVADGLWSRVGSSNLNAWSLLGNWEMDVGVLDASFAGQLEGIFLADLESSSEIVLPGRRCTRAVVPAEPLPTLPGLPATPLEPEGKLTERLEAMMDRETVSRPWRLAQLVRAGVSFGDALAGHRTLDREDRAILGTVAIIAISAAVGVGFFPLVFGWALALVLAWLGVVMGFRAVWHRFRALDSPPLDSKDEKGLSRR